MDFNKFSSLRKTSSFSTCKLDQRFFTDFQDNKQNSKKPNFI